MNILKEESNKAGSEVLSLAKWKLTIIAALAVVGLGWKDFKADNYTGLLLICSVGYLCAYIDWFIYRRFIVVHAIAKYFRDYKGNNEETIELQKYELFMKENRLKKLFFISDTWVHFICSITFSLGLPYLAYIKYFKLNNNNISNINVTLLPLASLGVLVVILLFLLFYINRYRLLYSQNNTDLSSANSDNNDYIHSRKLWEHEDMLINHRITWLGVVQALLFTAFGVVLSRHPSDYSENLLQIIPVIGIVLSFLIFVSVLGAAIAMIIIKRKALGESSDEIWLGVSNLTTAMGLVAPLFIPVVFLIVWNIIRLSY